MEHMFSKRSCRLAAQMLTPYLTLEAALLSLAKPYISFKGRDLPQSCRHVETFCMFIGYPRSGHTLISSLLDAHEHVILANELDVLKFIQAGLRKTHIYNLLIKNSQRQASSGRTMRRVPRVMSVFTRGGKAQDVYAVPNQWQGRFTTLRVIGDKKAMMTLVRFHFNPGLLPILDRTIGTPIKFIHVIRNPYDNIASISRFANMGLRTSIEFYFALAEAAADFKKHAQSHSVLDVKHESFVDNPRLHLNELCRFLEIDASHDFLEDCARIVLDSPRKSRREVEWTPDLIELARHRIAGVPFLEGYSYEA